MWQVDIAGFNLRTDGARSRLFAALRIHRHQTGDLMSERSHNGAAVRFVLDQLQRSCRPTLGEESHGAQGAREVQSLLGLIEQKAIGALLTPDLADDEIARRQILESHVPGLA